MKKKKKDIICILFLILLIIGYVIVTIGSKYVYGSTVDWDSQHWIIPEYFRNLFYETGKIIPTFAPHVGLGENIFYLSYYGLLNPIILFSYLLPFVKMEYYIQIVSILNLIVSAILFYKWMRTTKKETISFISTIFLVVANPMLLHSHRHIMFVSYMPFLILSLWGVDKYFKENKKTLLIASLFLLIMTNYFYSVGSIVTIVLYGIYKFLEKEKKITWKLFWKEGFRFLTPIFISILSSMILILPTFYIILAGRTESTVTIDLISLIKPSINLDLFFYNAYSLGMTSILLFSLIERGITKRKENIFIVITMFLIFIFPIFVYILNGTMYIDGKALIPFLPLMCYFISNTLVEIENKKVEWKNIFIISLIFVVLFLLCSNSTNKNLFITEFIVTNICLFMFSKTRKKIFLLTSAIIAITIGFSASSVDKLITKKDMDKITNNGEEELVKVLDDEKTVYRTTNLNYDLQNINRIFGMNYYQSSIYSSTSNNYYKNFYYEDIGTEITQRSYGKLSSSQNIFFNMYVGNKYLITENQSPIGYKKLKTKNNNSLYINEDVLPIMYFNSQIMSEEEYEKLEYPYNMEALLNYIIVKKAPESNYESKIKKIKLEADLEKENIEISKIKNGYHISSQNGKIKLKLNDVLENKVLMIKFEINEASKCPNDIEISINGIDNVLTCDGWKYHNKNYEFKYTISSNDAIEELEVFVSNGEIDITNIETYIIDYNELKKVKEEITEVLISKEEFKKGNINTKVTTEKDGYLYLSIPYDKGFEIYLNEQEVQYELVDKAFIGIKLEKGTYDIKIRYNAPLLGVGKAFSCLGIGIFIGNYLLESRKIKKNEKKACTK